MNVTAQRRHALETIARNLVAVTYNWRGDASYFVAMVAREEDPTQRAIRWAFRHGYAEPGDQLPYDRKRGRLTPAGRDALTCPDQRRNP
jgi:hypothetical protein